MVKGLLINIWSAPEYTGNTSRQGDGRLCETRYSVRSGEKTYNKILFVREHDIHCVDIISAIWFVYNELVFLEWNKK